MKNQTPNFGNVNEILGDKMTVYAINMPIELTVLLFIRKNFGVFFLPVLFENNYSNNNTEDCKYPETHIISHFYTPLSKIVPSVTKNTQKIASMLIFKTANSFDINEPKITIAKIKFAVLKNTLARFSRCFCVLFSATPGCYCPIL